MTAESEIDQALAALRQKYGWQMWLADVGSSMTGKFRKRAYIRVELTEDCMAISTLRWSSRGQCFESDPELRFSRNPSG